MKNIKQLTLVALFGVLYFAQVAGAQIEKEDTTRFSTRVAISPYAQAVPNDSYTFIGISHPSLDTALTQIGVVLEAVAMGTAAGLPLGAHGCLSGSGTVRCLDAIGHAAQCRVPGFRRGGHNTICEGRAGRVSLRSGVTVVKAAISYQPSAIS